LKNFSLATQFFVLFLNDSTRSIQPSLLDGNPYLQK